MTYGLSAFRAAVLLGPDVGLACSDRTKACDDPMPRNYRNRQSVMTVVRPKNKTHS